MKSKFPLKLLLKTTNISMIDAPLSRAENFRTNLFEKEMNDASMGMIKFFNNKLFIKILHSLKIQFEKFRIIRNQVIFDWFKALKEENYVYKT